MIKIETNYPNAVDSPDFIQPLGSAQDNHSNPAYLAELEKVAGSSDFSYLDLGCAGGQSVVDIYSKGNVACGVEGSNLDVMIASSKNREKPNPRFLGGGNQVLDRDVHDNWLEFKDVCLFKADITKPFSLKNESGSNHKFDIITAWDVMEHPKPEQIPYVLENVKNHLKSDGVFLCLVNMAPCYHHQCVKPKEWWVETFNAAGLNPGDFNFNTSPRHTCYPIGPEDVGFMSRHKK